jgi:alkylation response protein AidB-like acyl-CoA dehydrogenase
MIDFEPSEDQRLMRDAVGQLARSSFAARVRDLEKARAVPDELRRAVHEMGLGGVALPERVGGQGLGWVTAVLLEEEIARVDAAAAAALPGPGAFGTAVLELAAENEQAALLAPFFAPDGHDRFGAVAWGENGPCRERPGMSTVARRAGPGWRLDGKKSFVHNAGLAQSFVVLAQVEPEAGWRGLGAFVVPADRVRIGARHQTLGLDAAWFGEVVLEDVQLDGAARIGPADAEPFTAALLRFFAKRALVGAARCVGLGQRAFDLAREYCDTRVAFGKPIGHFQAVAFTLADRLMDVESARWLLWEAAWAWDAGKPERECLRRTAVAAAHASEVAMRTADDCVSLHGGMGFIRDVEAEKLMRDAKQLALCGATAEQLDQWATAVELGSPLDPALLLPTSETQAVFL